MKYKRSLLHSAGFDNLNSKHLSKVRGSHLSPSLSLLQHSQISKEVPTSTDTDVTPGCNTVQNGRAEAELATNISVTSAGQDQSIHPSVNF